MAKIVFTVVYDTEFFCDGFDEDTYDIAVGAALDVLMTWMYDGTLSWHPGDGAPTEDQRNEWNYFINNNECRIYKHEEGTEYTDDDLVWYMDAVDVEPIGWKEV